MNPLGDGATQNLLRAGLTPGRLSAMLDRNRYEVDTIALNLEALGLPHDHIRRAAVRWDISWPRGLTAKLEYLSS